MTKHEFVKKIEDGRDIMFDVNGRHFVIFTWPEEGIGIAEQDPAGDTLHYYETPELLLDGFMIDGTSLSSLCGSVVITDYS